MAQKFGHIRADSNQEIFLFSFEDVPASPFDIVVGARVSYDFVEPFRPKTWGKKSEIKNIRLLEVEI